MTITRKVIDQGAMLKFAGLDAAGVCLEACRRWVKAAINGRLIPGDTVYDIMDQGGLSELLRSHQGRNNLSEKGIEGLDVDVTRRTGGGVTKFKGLRTREDIINFVMATPGVYIYNATSKNGGGHAFAFNTVNPKLRLFFDPNLGEWEFEDESDAAMRTWWNDFWAGTPAFFNGKQSYKDAFHKGSRELWRYNVAT